MCLPLVFLSILGLDFGPVNRGRWRQNAFSFWKETRVVRDNKVSPGRNTKGPSSVFRLLKRALPSISSADPPLLNCRLGGRTQG